MFAASLYFIFTSELSFQDWIAFTLITCPASTFLFLMLYDSTNFSYAWANWYFSFVSFIIGFFYIILQTRALNNLKGKIGNGSIRFRINEAGNPLTPHLVGDSYMTDADYDDVTRTLSGFPKRYYDIQSFFHGYDDEFKWENGDATSSTSLSVINLFIWLDWVLFIAFGYFTLINYSYFIAAKSWTSYTGTTWSLSE